jgi:hypothetical protein
MKIFTVALLSLALGFFISSCSKKCSVSFTDTNTGEIIPNAIVNAKSSYLTGEMDSNYLINANHPYAYQFTMNLNDADSSVAVDYTQYSVLGYPILTSCDASFERSVSIDTVNQNVTYKIIVNQCSDCESSILYENYVLVPKIPVGYSITHDITIIDK